MAEQKMDGPSDEMTKDAPRSPEQIEAEIERTREELGETVAALAEKTDVKKQAQEKVDEAKAKARQAADAAAETAQDVAAEARRNPAPVIAAVSVVALVAIVVVRRRRR